MLHCCEGVMVYLLSIKNISQLQEDSSADKQKASKPNFLFLVLRSFPYHIIQSQDYNLSRGILRMRTML